MEEFDIIETPENVDLQRRLAGIGSRFAAGVLDHLLLGSLLAAVLLILFAFHVNLIVVGRQAARETDAVVLALLILIAFLVYWGYFLFFELWLNGQTPGKRYMKIRVVRLEGGAITFDAIAVRNLVRAADAMFGYGVAGVAMFMTRKVQRLGDLAAGTVVISEEIPDYAAKSDSKQKVLDDVPAPAEALVSTRLTPHEYRALRSYWLRREQLTIEARQRLLPQLMQPILQRLGMPFPADSPAVLEAQLEDLIARPGAARRAEVVARQHDADRSSETRGPAVPATENEPAQDPQENA